MLLHSECNLYSESRGKLFCPPLTVNIKWALLACVPTSCFRAPLTAPRGNSSRQGVRQSSARVAVISVLIVKTRDVRWLDFFLWCHYLWLASVSWTLWQVRQIQVSDSHTHTHTSCLGWLKQIRDCISPFGDESHYSCWHIDALGDRHVTVQLSCQSHDIFWG